MARHFVYSTLTSHQKYVKWKILPNGMQVHDGFVLIHGGANVATGSAPKVLTPRGIVTEVSDEEMALLQNDMTFKRHEANGFIHVQTVQDRPEKVAEKHMEARDDSAPLTPQILAEKAKDNDAKMVEESPSLLKKLRGG